MNDLTEILVAVAAVVLPLAVLCALNRFRLGAKVAGAAVFLAGIGFGVMAAGGTIGGIVDVPSAVIVEAFSVSLLFVAGRAGDVWNALKIAVFRKNAGRAELEKASLSLALLSRLILVGGLVGFLLGALGMLNNLDDLSAVGPNLAVALIAPLYALIASALVSALKTVIDAKIAEQ